MKRIFTGTSSANVDRKSDVFNEDGVEKKPDTIPASGNKELCSLLISRRYLKDQIKSFQQAEWK